MSLVGYKKALFGGGRVRSKHDHRHISLDVERHGIHVAAAMPGADLIVKLVQDKNVIIPENKTPTSSCK